MNKIVLLILAVGVSTAAQAHAFLQHASPAAGATPATPPREVSLEFSEPLDPAFSGVTVTDASGKGVEAAPPTVTGILVKVALKPLAPGIYRVAWHAVSVDTHRTEGAYRFTLKP